MRRLYRAYHRAWPGPLQSVKGDLHIDELVAEDTRARIAKYGEEAVKAEGHVSPVVTLFQEAFHSLEMITRVR